MQQFHKDNPDIILTSDASGSWGCGAFWDKSWFQYQWSSHTIDFRITIKELLPIVIATATWGPQWSKKSILCQCDNEAVVCIINSGTSRDPMVMSLMWCLHFIVAKFNLLISAAHLPGAANSLADSLSHDNLSFFLSNYPQANRNPSIIQPALLDLLVYSKPDWTSQSWTKMFNFIFNPPSPAAQCAHTLPATAATQTSVHAVESEPTPPQKPPCVSSQHTSVSKASNSKLSNVTSLESGSFMSCKTTPTPFSQTCPDSNTSYGASRPKKQKMDDHLSSACQ